MLAQGPASGLVDSGVALEQRGIVDGAETWSRGVPLRPWSYQCGSGGIEHIYEVLGFMFMSLISRESNVHEPQCPSCVLSSVLVYFVLPLPH
jgi:hypothetical protein